MDNNAGGVGKLSPDEYGADTYLIGIGQFGGNQDGIVTQDEWEARQRMGIAPSGLMAIRLERGPDLGAPTRARELGDTKRALSPWSLRLFITTGFSIS